MAYMEITCMKCFAKVMKRVSHVNQSLKKSGNLFCSRTCASNYHVPYHGVQIGERILATVNVNPATECWEWTGHIDRDGYARITVDSKPVRASRMSYQEFVGSIAEGLWALHRCDNRKCVNPRHIFLGTARDNYQDMVQKGRARWQQSK